MKICLAVTLALGVTVFAANPTSEQKTVSGCVIDSACAFTKGLTKPISVDCAVSCAKGGSPLVLLQDDGTIYWPIEDAMPAKTVNTRLLPYAGKHVSMSGKVYARHGSTAIVIDKVSESPAK